MEDHFDSRFPSIEHLRARAARRLPKFVLEYLEGGCNSEINLRRNTDEIREVRLMPRYLGEFGGADGDAGGELGNVADAVGDELLGAREGEAAVDHEVVEADAGELGDFFLGGEAGDEGVEGVVVGGGGGGEGEGWREHER